jgi:hypothetical protein
LAPTTAENRFYPVFTAYLCPIWVHRACFPCPNILKLQAFSDESETFAGVEHAGFLLSVAGYCLLRGIGVMTADGWG